VQNADDAGARKVCFCLDARQHGTQQLAGPKLDQFQGEGLPVCSCSCSCLPAFCSCLPSLACLITE
jgi:hypothetical protein